MVERRMTAEDEARGSAAAPGRTRPRLRLQAELGGGDSAAWSPDGTRVLQWGGASTRVIDAESGRTLLVLEGHAGGVNSASFSPDGSRIVTGSWDRTARIWDASTGEQLHVLEGHADKAISASFSPDGSRIVTASDDRTARIWDASTGCELAWLLAFTDGSWAVVEPGTGRYDAGSAPGVSDGSTVGLHGVRDDRVVLNLKELRDRYWDRGLLAKVLGRHPEPLREVPPLT